MDEITPIFNAAAAGPEADGVPSDAPTPQSPAPSSSAAEIPSESSPLRVEFANAEAQLAALEEGRATPGPRLNLNPPTRIMRASHAPIERQREARARALQAYIHGQEHKPSETQYDEGEDLELSW